MKKVHVVTVSALFPELPGGICNQRGKGEGRSVKLAAGKAIVDLLNQPGLKRRRFSTFNANFSVGFRLEE